MEQHSLKDSLSRWLPLLVTLAVLVANVAAQIAVAKQGAEEFRTFRDAGFVPFKEDVQKNYVTFREYEMRMRTMELSLQRIENKVDRMLEQGKSAR